MVERSSTDYNESLTKASFSALLELAVTLKSYRESIVLVGGWVPYLLIDEFGRGDFKHVGSIDIDLAIDPKEIDVNVYNTIVELIEDRGYKNRLDKRGDPIIFSFSKSISSPLDGKEHMIGVDFLTYGTDESTVHRHRTVQTDLPARIAGGCELAFEHNINKRLNGVLPGNGETVEDIKMLDIAGCVGMKGIVLGDRYKEKDAYDIYSVVRYCLDDPKAVAGEIKPYIEDDLMREGIRSIKQKFRDIRAEGPSWVANFISLDPEEKEREQAAAYITIKEFLDEL